jgi:hypothetical protein
MALRIRLARRKLIVGNFDLNHIRSFIVRNLVDLVEDRDIRGEISAVIVEQSALWIWKVFWSSECETAPTQRSHLCR